MRHISGLPTFTFAKVITVASRTLRFVSIPILECRFVTFVGMSNHSSSSLIEVILPFKTSTSELFHAGLFKLSVSRLHLSGLAPLSRGR